MSRRGRSIYIPPSIIDVADEIMKNKKYKTRVKAFKDVAQYARVGIEAEKIYKLDFSDIFGKKIKRRRK